MPPAENERTGEESSTVADRRTEPGPRRSGGNSIRLGQRYAVRADLSGIIDVLNRGSRGVRSPLDSLRQAVAIQFVAGCDVGGPAGHAA